LPNVAGGLVVSIRLMRLAEADEGVGTEVAVAGVCVGVEGLLIVIDRLAVAAGLVAAVTEAVQSHGFAEPVARVAVQFEGFLAVAEGSLVVAK